jgi:hypothetical protein
MFAPVFGCEENAGGVWFMRVVANTQDENYDGTLRAEEGRLLELVDTMSLDEAFRGGVWFDRSTSTIYTLGAGGVVNSSDLSDQAIGSAPNWLNNYADIYTQSMQTYLTRTAGQVPDLVEYMQWFMARRDTTLQTVSIRMNPMAGNAFLTNWGYQQFPWFWQLADPIAIASYIDERGPTDELPDPSANPPDAAQDNPLVLMPAEIIARPGDVVLVEIEFPRLQGIHSVAFMVYAEKMWPSNLPMAFVDQSGDFACSSGHEEDIVPPVQRALDIVTTPDYPPTFLELEIDPGVRDEDRLSLCVEMIGFSLDREVFAWNARIDIRIVE